MMMRRLMTGAVIALSAWATTARADDFAANSFEEVTARLEPGGDVYLYMSTDTVMSTLSTRVAEWRESMVPAVEAEAEGSGAQVAAVFNTGIAVIDDGGLRDVAGVGISSIQTSETNHRTTAFVHVPPGEKPGMLLELLGRPAHELSALKLLPKHTVMALNADFDAARGWSWLESLVRSADGPGWAAGWQEQVEALRELGVDLPALMADMDGEFTLVMTMNPSRQVQIPTGDGVTLEMGEPALALVMKVKGDALFHMIDEKLTEMEVPHTRSDEADMRLRLLQGPGKLPFKVLPTVARFADYLVIATSDDLAVDIANTLRGTVPGLASTPEFAEWSRDLPATGNGFLLMTPVLTKAIADVRQTMLEKLLASEPDTAAIEPLLRAVMTSDTYYLYNVVGRTDDGLLSVANGSQGGSSLLVKQMMFVPVAVSAGVLLPVLSKARNRARRVNSGNNLSQLGLGLGMYTDDHGGKLPTPDGAAGLEVIRAAGYLDAGRVYINPRDDREAPVDAVTEATTSYAYFGAGMDIDHELAAVLPLAVEKPTNDPWVNVLFLDGHVEGFPFPGESIEGIIDMLDDHYDYEKPTYQMLMEKARKLDDANKAE